MRDEIKELNAETRKAAGRSFIQLPNGMTHYELGGNDPLLALSGVAPFVGTTQTKRDDIVLIHGFSVPSFIYDPTFEFLTQSGFRVLRYDLFGRGYSDRPRVRYNLELFVKQLTDLLDALRFARPVNLIGLSMGGLIASAFTVCHPERVNKLVLIDPVGAKSIELTPTLKVAKIPLVAEAVLSFVGSEVLIQNIAKDVFDPRLVDHFQAQYKIQMQYKGFQRAILSTMRNGMLDSFIKMYETLGTMNKEILLFWGRNDNTVPFEHSKTLCAALPKVQLQVIENCGHIPHYEKPDEVNPILLEFLNEQTRHSIALQIQSMDK